MYPEGYGQRVLVVDDDASIRSLLSVLLTYEGYNVFEAGDGLEAVHELKKRHFDVVISDYRMPRFDGMQLLTMCRLLWPETAVVIVSGEESDWTELAIRRGSPRLGKEALRTEPSDHFGPPGDRKVLSADRSS